MKAYFDKRLTDNSNAFIDSGNEGAQEHAQNENCELNADSLKAFDLKAFKFSVNHKPASKWNLVSSL